MGSFVVGDPPLISIWGATYYRMPLGAIAGQLNCRKRFTTGSYYTVLGSLLSFAMLVANRIEMDFYKTAITVELFAGTETSASFIETAVEVNGSMPACLSSTRI